MAEGVEEMVKNGGYDNDDNNDDNDNEVVILGKHYGKGAAIKKRYSHSCLFGYSHGNSFFTLQAGYMKTRETKALIAMKTSTITKRKKSMITKAIVRTLTLRTIREMTTSTALTTTTVKMITMATTTTTTMTTFTTTVTTTTSSVGEATADVSLPVTDCFQLVDLFFFFNRERKTHFSSNPPSFSAFTEKSLGMTFELFQRSPAERALFCHLSSFFMCFSALDSNGREKTVVEELRCTEVQMSQQGHNRVLSTSISCQPCLKTQNQR